MTINRTPLPRPGGRPPTLGMASRPATSSVPDETIKATSAGARLMTGRHGGIAADGEGNSQADTEGNSQADTEVEVAATVAMIARLRSRLRNSEILEDPKVLKELYKLEQQVTAQLAYADQKPGRHRSAGDTAISEEPDDASGSDLKPNPSGAKTPAQFLAVLRQYKAWSGDPSWRRMATRAGQAVVHSTMYSAMNGDALPKFEVVRAVIIGCGGGDEDLDSFTRVWHEVKTELIVSTRRAVPEHQGLPPTASAPK